jgi:hypothetical protein
MRTKDGQRIEWWGRGRVVTVDAKGYATGHYRAMSGEVSEAVFGRGERGLRRALRCAKGV